MPKRHQRPERERQIHVRLSEKTHKQLRVHAATLDTSMQNWTVSVIEDALKQARGQAQ